MKFLSNFSLKKLLHNKQFTITFSVITAFTLWLFIVINQKPTIERTFSDIPVNVNLENTFAAENNMSIIGDISDQRFTVTVRGPSYIVSSLTGDELALFASAGEVDAPGEYELKVAAAGSSTALEYEVLNITPPVLKTTFDYVETKTFIITALAEGAVADKGLIAENAVVSGAESDTITITGPRSVVNKIEVVTASAIVNKTLSASETFEADIVLLDENGKTIKTDNLTLSTKKVNVTVPISKKKTVPVKVEFSNIPSGFDSSSVPVNVNHKTVTVIGTPETVDKTTEVSLSSIDITTISPGSNKFEVSAKLPEGVRLLENIEFFTVEIDTEGYISKTFNVKSIKYNGIASGLSVSGPKTIANVKVFGPRSVINSLEDSDIVAEVNLSDKTEGVYTADTVINFKNKKNIWALGKYTTTVTLK